MNHTEQRANLYKELKGFYGSIGEIAERSGFHRNYVRLVLQQKHGMNNEDIWITAAEVLIELKNQRAEKQARVAKMMAVANQITLF